MSVIRKQVIDKLGFILRAKIIHSWIYRVFVYLLIFKTRTTHGVIFLRPLGNLSSFFTRYRCTVGGQQVQDFIEYNRHCELYNSFKSQNARDMDDLEGGANPRWDDDWRHTYATGFAEFIDANNERGTTGTAPDAVTVVAGDHKNWGDLTSRYRNSWWQYWLYEIRT